MVPLTGVGGIQAWKILIPADQTTPAPRRHDGFEWLYVLSGRLRVLLGDQDVTVGVGEVIEFDTRVPHWFGSTGEGPAEVLSIFGRPGERMTVAAQPTPGRERPRPADEARARGVSHSSTDSVSSRSATRRRTS